MFGIKFTLAKVLGGALLMLAVIAAGLAWQYRGELIKSSGLESTIKQLQQTNKENKKAIAQMMRELEVYEQALAVHSANYAQAEADHNERVKTLQTQLDELRNEFETIDDFLDTPVPAEYVRYRMLQEAPGGHNKN